jgi:hypothetical protein
VVESFPRDDGQREPKAREERERELLRGDGLEAAGETETFCQPAYNSHTVGSTDAEAITTGQQMCWPCGCQRREPCQLATSSCAARRSRGKRNKQGIGGHCDCRATSPVQGATGGVSSRLRCMYQGFAGGAGWRHNGRSGEDLFIASMPAGNDAPSFAPFEGKRTCMGQLRLVERSTLDTSTNAALSLDAGAALRSPTRLGADGGL